MFPSLTRSSAAALSCPLSRPRHAWATSIVWSYVRLCSTPSTTSLKRSLIDHLGQPCPVRPTRSSRGSPLETWSRFDAETPGSNRRASEHGSHRHRGRDAGTCSASTEPRILELPSLGVSWPCLPAHDR